MTSHYTERQSDEDAEKILIEIMHRKNHTILLRVDLAKALREIIAREIERCTKK